MVPGAGASASASPECDEEDREEIGGASSYADELRFEPGGGGAGSGLRILLHMRSVSGCAHCQMISTYVFSFGSA